MVFSPDEPHPAQSDVSVCGDFCGTCQSAENRRDPFKYDDIRTAGECRGFLEDLSDRSKYGFYWPISAVWVAAQRQDCAVGHLSWRFEEWHTPVGCVHRGRVQVGPG